MSHSRSYTIWCDEPGCGDWIAEDPTLAEARATAKRHAWTRSDQRDYCPDHSLDATRCPAISNVGEGDVQCGRKAGHGGDHDDWSSPISASSEADR